MVNQTMLLSDNKKLENQGYVNFKCNFLLVINIISKSWEKRISRKLNLVSKLLGIISKNKIDWSKFCILMQYYKKIRTKIRSRHMSDHLNQIQMTLFLIIF